MAENYQNDKDFKYVIQDTASTQLGSRFTYDEMLMSDRVPFKFQSIIQFYILKTAESDEEIGKHILRITDDDYNFQVYRQLKIKIRFCEPKSNGGFKVKQLKFVDFKKYQKISWTDKHVIQDVTISNLALMGFSV